MYVCLLRWNVTGLMSKYGYPFNRLRDDRNSQGCDPYQEHGHLFTSDDLFESRYIIYNDPSTNQDQTGIGSSPSSQNEDWTVPSLSASLHSKKFESLDFMRNRTILLIGDSIDRNLVIHFGRRVLQGLNGSHSFFVPPDWAKLPILKQEAHQIGVAHSNELNFTMYNWFLMGLDVQEEVPFFHPREDLPQDFESRLETFFLPALRKGLLPRPDLLVFNTGFWDLEFLARSRASNYSLMQDSRHRDDHLLGRRRPEAPTNLKTHDRGDGNPISLDDLAYHRNRLRRFIMFLKKSLEEIDLRLDGDGREKRRRVEMMYRSIQLGNTVPKNAFAAERICQLEESNRMVVEQFGIPIVEWGRMTIGLNYQLDDTIIHYGVGSVQFKIDY
ncbi:hypothetical protein BY996DRAFT_7664622 [Phakopsora pachyrhizi]|nr:hypothetical protein BY996DRAFT_7664622 [Phakopsora pachyrhizi]